MQKSKHIEEVKVNKKAISTEKLSSHKICAYSYKLVCCLDGTFSKSIKLFRGENAAYKFIEAMLKEEKYCKKY